MGLQIDPAGAVPELNPHDQSGVHRGEDWETLTVLTPVRAGVTNLSQADPSLDTQADGTLLTPGQADTYTFTVTQTQGSGRLTAAVTPTADTLTPLLTLAGPDGTVLVQSAQSDRAAPATRQLLAHRLRTIRGRGLSTDYAVRARAARRASRSLSALIPMRWRWRT